MRLSGLALASSRRAFIILITAAATTIATVASAQQAPAAGGQAPAAPAPAQDPDAAFRFATGSGAIIWLVKPTSVGDFEAVWGEIRRRLAASEKPELKELGASLKVYKWDIPASADGVTYLFVADPASKTTSYSPSPFLLFSSGLFADQAEARALYDKLAGSLTSVNPIPLLSLQPGTTPYTPAPAAAAPAAPAAQ